MSVGKISTIVGGSKKETSKLFFVICTFNYFSARVVLVNLDLLNSIPYLISANSPEILFSYIPFTNPTNHPDVIFLNQDGEGLTIDLVRSLGQSVLTKPYQETYRIFILQNVELATIEAQQALLKLLEEPPAHVRFLLTTQYPSMVLSTILSRVQLEESRGEGKKNTQEVSEKESEENNQEIVEENSSRNATELRNMDFQNLANRLNWAGQPALHENPVKSILALYGQALEQFEQEPNSQHLNQLKILQQVFRFLQAKVNSKLAMEWLALRW